MTTKHRSPLAYAAETALKNTSGLLNFSPNPTDVDWHSLLSYAEKSIDVVVCFWANWTEKYEKELLQFLNKPGTRLRFVMPDPRNPLILKETSRLFPEFADHEVLARIVTTQRRLSRIAEQIPKDGGKLELYLLPRLVSYPCQRIDDEIVLFSLFEMYRQKKVSAPVITVHLEESSHLKEFFEREWKGVLTEAIRCDLAAQLQ